MKSYELNTFVGRLEIHTESWEHMKGSYIYSIYVSFDDPRKVLNESIIKCNPCSGKYNFHMSDKEEIIENFKNFIEYVK